MLQTQNVTVGHRREPQKDSDVRVLIVEDDPDAASTMAKLLSAWGWVPEVAHGALDALRRPGSESFALALVDVSLGGELDGVDVAEWLSSLYGIPIVFATAAVDDGVLLRARKVRPVGYLVKPIEPSQLRASVTVGLGRTLAEAGETSESPAQEFAYLQRKLEQIRGVVDEVRLGQRTAAKRAGRLPAGIEELSQREWQIMRDLVHTPSVDAIAAQRHLSVHTVQNHVKAVFRKLDVHSTAELLSLLLVE